MRQVKSCNPIVAYRSTNTRSNSPKNARTLAFEARDDSMIAAHMIEGECAGRNCDAMNNARSKVRYTRILQIARGS
jgi:hypothetical protein